MMDFPLFQIFPLFQKNFSRLRRKFSQFYLFLKKSKIFIRQISDDIFLVIDYKFVISPYFCSFSPFPLFLNNFHFSPTFSNLPTNFIKCSCFLHAFGDFRFPPSLTMMHLCIPQCMGLGGALLESLPVDRRVVGSNPAIAAK